jgi:hypothetical protein
MAAEEYAWSYPQVIAALSLEPVGTDLATRVSEMLDPDVAKVWTWRSCESATKGPRFSHPRPLHASCLSPHPGLCRMRQVSCALQDRLEPMCYIHRDYCGHGLMYDATTRAFQVCSFDDGYPAAVLQTFNTREAFVGKKSLPTAEPFDNPCFRLRSLLLTPSQCVCVTRVAGGAERLQPVGGGRRGCPSAGRGPLRAEQPAHHAREAQGICGPARCTGSCQVDRRPLVAG